MPVALSPHAFSIAVERDTAWRGAREFLARRGPLVFVLRRFPSFAAFSTPTGEPDGAWAPLPGEAPAGFHTLVCVGFRDADGGGGHFRFLNSWGEEWGHGGLAWISYAYVSRIADEVWALDAGPDLATHPLEPLVWPE